MIRVVNARWIVGVDGSLGSRSALAWALRESDRVGAELAVVHAYGSPINARVRSVVGAADDRDSRAATSALDELDTSISDLVGRRRVECVVADRPPGKALVEAGADADVIVVGRHGIGGGWRETIGSVSRYCVTHATVPTVVVPLDWNRGDIDDVVIGFDGSKHAAAALQWAMAFAPADARLRAVIAIELAPWLSPDIVEERLADELAAERRRLTDAIDAADTAQIVEREIIVRGARPALARAAEQADLVVLGRRGAGTIASLVIGSVSTWMIEGATRPVAVIPPSTTDS